MKFFKPETALISVAAVLAIYGSFRAYRHFNHRRVIATVTAARWERSTHLEKRSTKHTENWNYPVGAFNTSCTSKLYGHESCNPHSCNPHTVYYDCGYWSYGRHHSHYHYRSCSRLAYDTCWDSCPIYKEWCAYDYFQWDPIASATTAGGFCSDSPVKWPVRDSWPKCQDETGAGVCPMPGDDLTRATMTEHYDITFTTEKGEYRSTPADRATFCSYELGDTWDSTESDAGYFEPKKKQ